MIKRRKRALSSARSAVFSEKAPITTRFRQHGERQDEAADFFWRRVGRPPKHCETQKSWSSGRIPQFLLLFLKLQLYKKCS